jgi:hypothetical protein
MKTFLFLSTFTSKKYFSPFFPFGTLIQPLFPLGSSFKDDEDNKEVEKNNCFNRRFISFRGVGGGGGC